MMNKRAARWCCPFFVSALFLLFPGVLIASVADSDIEQVRRIAETGAVSLALQSIDEQQQNIDYQQASEDWLQWERERLQIYELGKRWQVLQQRVADYDFELPDEFYFQARLKQVDALLTLRQGQQARQVLQKLIWQNERRLDETQLLKWLPQWQKRVIRSYLVDNAMEDALLAAQRYYQDYQSNNIEDRLLRARILLINHREDEVVRLLMKDTRHPEGGMLYLLAQLRSKERPAQKVLQAALRQMRGKWANEKLKYMLWAVVAESAKQSRDRPSTAKALEYVLAGHRSIKLPAGLFHFNADSLWDAYLDYASYIGNEAQFLIGKDRQWLKAAAKAAERYPVKARSLYALVILKGQSRGTRAQAARGFLRLMHHRRRGAHLVSKLFLESNHFKNLLTIPAPVRYDLVKIALSRSNIELASRLMTTVKKAPAKVDPFQWQLRRARIFVLGGEAEKGYQALEQILQQYPKLEKKQIEYFLQVVFDLQTTRQHALAYNLFAAVLPRVKDATMQREIYYWMADSKKALQQYAEAARLYLRSALHNGNNGLDPWGQTARYQVAEMLTHANMTEDAHAIYQHLLRVTKDPARRAVLKHELQKLWLLKSPQETEATADTQKDSDDSTATGETENNTEE